MMMIRSGIGADGSESPRVGGAYYPTQCVNQNDTIRYLRWGASDARHLAVSFLVEGKVSMAGGSGTRPPLLPVYSCPHRDYID